MTKLSSSLPKDNGLDAILDELLEDPRKRRVVVAVVDCPKITEDTESGDRDATVRVLRIEQIHPDDRDDAERLIRRAVEHRTGTEGLPIDWLDPARPSDPVTVDTRAGVVVVPSDAHRALSLVPADAIEDPDEGEWPADASDVDDDDPEGGDDND